MSTQIWQSQPLEAPRISLEYVQHQVERLNKEVRHRHFISYVAAVVGVLFVLVISWHPRVQSPESFTQALRLGAVLYLLGMVYLMFQIRRRGKIVAAQKDESVVRSLDAYRTELQRRRDYSLGALRWSLWPMVPCVVVWLGGGMLYDQRPNKLMHYGLAVAWCVVLAPLLALWRSRRQGQKYQRELDALATLDTKVGE